MTDTHTIKSKRVQHSLNPKNTIQWIVDSDALISFLCLLIFLVLRSQHYSGDGVLIARMTEGGKWLVQNELLSQTILQGLFQLAHPFHLTAREVMNYASCLGGALSIWLLIRFARMYQIHTGWPLTLFFSSGFFIYSCGHTEYYPLLLPAMILFGYAGIQYLRGGTRIYAPATSFLLACGLHFAMLFALPSLLLLPYLRNRKRDWGSIFLWLSLLIPLMVIRNNPQFLGHKAASLSPAWNFLALFPHEGMYQSYAVFQWGHWCDWLYAWSMRSWVFWPAIVASFIIYGRTSFFTKERLFIVLYTLPFTFWTALWHPDLGIEADWDLFAIEAAPCLLLLISCLPELVKRKSNRILLSAVCLASIGIALSHVNERADLPISGFGSLQLEGRDRLNGAFTVNGTNRTPYIPRIQGGVYRVKLIDREEWRAYEAVVVVEGKRATKFEIE